MEKNVFIFDQNRCVGCEACVVACMNENPDQVPGSWRTVYGRDTNHLPLLPLFYLSMACNHCDDAPCLKNCPALAYTIDKNTGAVVHHPEKCIGCKYCTWACPYDAPVYNHASGIIEKCTFCNSRLHEGLKPACTTHCPVDALRFEKKEFNKDKALISSPVPVKVGSSLEVVELVKKEAPLMDEMLFTHNPKVEPDQEHIISTISAKSEWPLLAFSLLSVIMVSMLAFAERFSTSGNINWMVLGIAVIAAVTSMFHTGKKLRLWRAVLNVKQSWLSREILFLILFATLVLIDAALVDIPALILFGTGFLFLFIIDRLYMLANWNWPYKLHSANTVLMATGLVLWIYGFLWVFIVFSLFRIVLYLMREHILTNSISRGILIIRPLFMIAAILLYAFTAFHPAATILLLAGEITDRIEFYNELRLPRPEL